MTVESIYTKKLGMEICRLLAEGMSMNKICKYRHMPARCTIYVWLQENPEFAAMHLVARQEQAATIVDDMLDMNALLRGEGDHVPLTSDQIKALRLVADNTKWLACKWAPKTFGDKHQHEIGGSTELPPIHIILNRAPDNPQLEETENVDEEQ